MPFLFYVCLVVSTGVVDCLDRLISKVIRVTTCLENLEMSGNLTAVSEMSRILLKVREVSGKKSCQGKVA